jgi:hypothetical protein
MRILKERKRENKKRENCVEKKQTWGSDKGLRDHLNVLLQWAKIDWKRLMWLKIKLGEWR